MILLKIAAKPACAKRKNLASPVIMTASRIPKPIGLISVIYPMKKENVKKEDKKIISPSGSGKIA